MEGSVVGLAIGNLLLGLIGGVFVFVIATLLARLMWWFIFDTGVGAFVGFFPAMGILGLGVFGFMSFTPPVLDWSMRVAVLFGPQVVLALISAYPFSRFYGRPARPGQSLWAMAASVGLIYAGMVPLGVALVNAALQAPVQLVDLPLL